MFLKAGKHGRRMTARERKINGQRAEQHERRRQRNTPPRAIPDWLVEVKPIETRRTFVFSSSFRFGRSVGRSGYLDLPVYAPPSIDFRDIRQQYRIPIGAAARACGIEVSVWCDIERGRLRPVDGDEGRILAMLNAARGVMP